MSAPHGLQAIVAHMAAIAGDAPAGHLLELRHALSAGGMGQRFYDVARPDAAAMAAFVLGRDGDVYVGGCPRARREGTRDAIEHGWALWADCDDRASVAALEAFAVPPAIVVRSGTDTNCHAYWPLTTPLAPGALEQANRRLAAALGADTASVDAARVLRVPGTRNFKHDPPTAVTAKTFTGERFDPAAVLEVLAPLEQPVAPAPPQAALEDRHRPVDPLRAIEPEVYVAALTGLQVGRDRKVACPFHEDNTPSLHVYKTPADGWTCFGCRRGGSVYDLGGAVFGLSTKGAQFLQLRERLYELLLPGQSPPRPRRTRRRRVPA